MSDSVETDQRVNMHRVFLAWSEPSPGCFVGQGTLDNKTVIAHLHLEATGWVGRTEINGEIHVLPPSRTLEDAKLAAAPEFISSFWRAAEQASNHVATWPEWRKAGFVAGTRGKISQEPPS